MQNMLFDEKNPYLKMHQHQPIHWFPWGNAAFEKADAEHKPIFLSIGYSTCHWCHVMAKESFDDIMVAEILNESFVCIKVDREEHPEVDSVYTDFCYALTGSGGWPLSVFLTPDLKPFFAGTYFPKYSSKNRMGFLELITIIADKWEENCDILVNNAKKIVAEVSNMQKVSENEQVDFDPVQSTYRYLSSEYDEIYGGFGDAPKFPTPHKLLFLLDHYIVNPSEKTLGMIEHTAKQMAKGGIFDHIGGGFCRYSTDEKYLVPHFEKMLYDNALMISFYSRLYAITNNSMYLNIAELTASFLCRDMKSPSGGFYAAQDADSDGEEGAYYLFTRNEILNILGEKDGNLFIEKYNISLEGNFEGKNIPNLLNHDITADEYKINDTIKKRLLVYRKERMDLFTDHKVLTSWNAMTAAAFIDLYRASNKSIYLSLAEEILLAIRKIALSCSLLFRGYYEDRKMAEGNLDDYAWYIYALIQLHQITLNDNYLKEIIFWSKKVNELFLDEEKGGYFQNSKNRMPLVLSIKETFDSAIPSGNSVMCENLRMISFLTNDMEWEHLRDKQLSFMKRSIGQKIGHSAFYSMVIHRMENEPDQIIYVPYDANYFGNYISKISQRTMVKIKHNNEQYPILNQRDTFYICNHNSCLPPTNELK